MQSGRVRNLVVINKRRCSQRIVIAKANSRFCLGGAASFSCCGIRGLGSRLRTGISIDLVFFCDPLASDSFALEDRMDYFLTTNVSPDLLHITFPAGTIIKTLDSSMLKFTLQEMRTIGWRQMNGITYNLGGVPICRAKAANGRNMMPQIMPLECLKI